MQATAKYYRLRHQVSGPIVHKVATGKGFVLHPPALDFYTGSQYWLTVPCEEISEYIELLSASLVNTLCPSQHRLSSNGFLDFGW